MDGHDLFNTAMALANLPEDTDSNDWEIRNQILYTQNEPGFWQLICLVAATMTTDPIITIWLLIEHINGWRRQAGKWDIAYAVEMMAHIRMKIEMLGKDHPRYYRLMTLWHYHAGCVYVSAGDFVRAAECHLQTLNHAIWDDDLRGQILALYNVSHMALNAAILEKRSVTEAYQTFAGRIADIHRHFSQNVFEDLRWRANAYFHEIFYGWLIEKAVPSSEALEFLRDLPENLKPAFCLDIIWAIEKPDESSSEAAQLLFNVFMTEPPNQAIENQASALLVYYAIVKSRGACPDWLILELDKIQEQGHGGHIARAAIKHGLV